MKKTMITTCMALLITLSVVAQGQVPREAVGNFNRTFPKASYAQWDKKGDLHTVSFVQDSNRVTAYFDNNGELFKYTRYIESRNLPLGVQQALNQAYELYDKDKTVMEVTQGDGSTMYLISFEHRGRAFIVQSTPAGDLMVIRKEKI